MRVALFITCFTGPAVPGRRQGDGRGAAAWATRSSSRTPRRAAARCTSTPLPRRLRPARSPVRRDVRRVRRGRDAVGVVRGDGPPPPRDCGRGERRRSAARRRRGGRAAGRRAGGVPRRRPGVVDVGRASARGGLPPDLPLAAAAPVGDRPQRLRRQSRPATLVDLPGADECCGFGGTFAVKNADTSIAMGDDKVDALVATGAEVLTSADTSPHAPRRPAVPARLADPGHAPRRDPAAGADA